MSRESVAEYVERLLADAEPEPRGPERRGQLRGEQHPKACLTEAQVREILRRKEAGEGVTSIARQLELGHSAVSAVFYGTTWRHISRAAAAAGETPPELISQDERQS